MNRNVLYALLLAVASGCNNNPIDEPEHFPDLKTAFINDLANYGADLMLPKRDPREHPELHIMANNGGPIIHNIEIWTVVWQGDEALGDRIHLFTDWMVQSDEYWIASMGEYGIGKGTAKGVIVIPNAAPANIDDSGFAPIIRNAIASGLFPMPNPSTLFQFIVPPTTKSTLQGSKGCETYGGYHSETRIAAGSNTRVPYAVNLQCSGFGGTAFDGLTEVVSHEASEVATDPHPFTQPAFVSGGQPQGGEISDLCAGLSVSFNVQQTASDGGALSSTYYVTRNWSNKAVLAGDIDPCQPMPPGKAFFNVAVDPIEIEIETDAAGKGHFTGEIKPFAYADVGLMKWAFLGAGGPGITITPETGSGYAGDTFKVYIDVDDTAQAGLYSMRLHVQTQKGGQTQWVSALTVR